MERSEHLEEAKAALLNILEASNHIRVSGGIELVFDFLKLQNSITVSIELVESLVHKSLSNWAHFTTECCQKFIEADLTVTTGIEHTKEAFGITGAHSWHTVVIKDSLELTETELARTISVHDRELLLEADQTFGTAILDPLLESVDDHSVLGTS